MPERPAWICADCGAKHGSRTPKDATWHIGSPCGWCGTTSAAVTEPRDYGWPPAPDAEKGDRDA